MVEVTHSLDVVEQTPGLVGRARLDIVRLGRPTGQSPAGEVVTVKVAEAEDTEKESVANWSTELVLRSNQ